VSGFPRALCRLEEVPDGGAKGFDLGPDYEPLGIFLLRQGREIFAYVNSCPHLGTPLEMIDDQFVNEDGYILCATHGALFQPNEGVCISGPCMGEYLSRAKIRLEEDGRILLVSLPFSSQF